MPQGFPYFAWVTPSETTWSVTYLRWDEEVFSFEVSQKEGDFARLTAVIRNPRTPLLAAGRPIHAWLTIDCGTGGHFKFFGRLVGIPTDILQEEVTLLFIARPSDYEAQKVALAETLKVLPYYDVVFVDPKRESDSDVVFEAYPRIPHTDRETHVVTAAHELYGDDGEINFTADDMFYDGLSMRTNGTPLNEVAVAADFQWTQAARGSIDLTDYLARNWPGAIIPTRSPLTRIVITSFTFDESSWPQVGTSMGDGWTVSSSSAEPMGVKAEVHHRECKYKTIYINDPWPGGAFPIEGEKLEIETDYSEDYIWGGSGGLNSGWTVTDYKVETKVDDGETVSFSETQTSASHFLPIKATAATLAVTFDAQRPFTERVNLTVTADLQAFLTEPGDETRLILSDMRTVSLSDPLTIGSVGEIPIGDPGRRSYIVTDRGLQSLKHLVTLSRTYLLKRSRVIELTIEPQLYMMPAVTLRKSGRINDDRIPEGQAVGKIIGYSISLHGDQGAYDCRVDVGCTIGRGGSTVVLEQTGTPDYVLADYIEDAYQEFTGRFLFVDDDQDITMEQVHFLPSDDGLDLVNLTVADIIEEPLQVQWTAVQQAPYFSELLTEAHMKDLATKAQNQEQQQIVSPWNPCVTDDISKMLAQSAESVNDKLKDKATVATFKLKSMKTAFDTSQIVEVSDLRVPMGIDLEGGSA